MGNGDFVQRFKEMQQKKKNAKGDYDLFPRPGTQFCIHVSLRSIQTAALLGSVLGPVSALLFRHQRREEPDRTLVDAMVQGGIHGAMVGAVLSPFITLATVRNMNALKKYQNYYKLKFDQSQLWQDHIVIASAAIGYLGHGKLGFVVGLDLSLLFALLTRHL